jgi:hypothetical protein
MAKFKGPKSSFVGAPNAKPMETLSDVMAHNMKVMSAQRSDAAADVEKPNAATGTGGNWYNHVLSGIAVPHKSFLHHFSGRDEKADFLLRKFRKDLTSATRISLSPQFLEIAVELGMSYPKYLTKAIARSTPPLENIWIEWNEGERFAATSKVLKKMGAKHVEPENVANNDTGYLIRSDHRGGYEFQCVFQADHGNGKEAIGFPPLSWMFNPNADEPYTTDGMNRQRVVQGLPMVGRDTDEANRVKLITALWGADYMNVHKGQDVYGDLLQTWQWNVTSSIHDLGPSMYPPLYNDTESVELAENADTMHLGDMRFLVAVFALLNYPRIVRMDAPSPKKVSAIRWGRPLPKNEVKVVEVDLPKRRGVNLYQQLFTGQGAPKRQHERRGHPRRYKDAQGRIIKEIWIKPMTVGNPELGVIEHEYFLKAGGDRFKKSKNA